MQAKVIKEKSKKLIQFIHNYLLVNIYTLQVEAMYPEPVFAKKMRDTLNRQYKHPDHYPADAKAPYIIVVVREGEVIE